MAGDIDDVVGAAHHPDIAILVLVAGIGGFVVAGEFGEEDSRSARPVATELAGSPAASAA